ncbi:MAG: DJ-1/PfpI family protein, partial [Candidatus Eisenbacteria bacterium]|nr:DJ-1/PfpI family protein [Candidatus Eisenbacteria bacterium]
TLDNVDIDEFDMIALPGGGPGAENLKNDSRIGAILQTYAMQEKWIAAICAAPKVLAAAGILDGKKATSYPGILEAEDLPTTELTQNPVQVDGKVITSRGPGTAMDFALTLIEVLAGSEKRTEVETPLQRPVA